MRSEDKEWIDGASYRDLLKRFRFSPVGDEIFIRDTGIYYAEVLAKKAEAVGRENAVAASKEIGWEKPG